MFDKCPIRFSSSRNQNITNFRYKVKVFWEVILIHVKLMLGKTSISGHGRDMM